jgi:hypothetical protein
MGEIRNGPPDVRRYLPVERDGRGKVAVMPDQLVAHEIGHNLSSDDLSKNHADDHHYINTDKIVPDHWIVNVHARSSTGPSEYTADDAAHWGLYGSDATPAAVNQFMRLVIQNKFSVDGHEDPVRLNYASRNGNERLSVSGGSVIWQQPLP